MKAQKKEILEQKSKTCRIRKRKLVKPTFTVPLHIFPSLQTNLISAISLNCFWFFKFLTSPFLRISSIPTFLIFYFLYRYVFQSDLHSFYFYDQVTLISFFSLIIYHWILSIHSWPYLFLLFHIHFLTSSFSLHAS